MPGKWARRFKRPILRQRVCIAEIECRDQKELPCDELYRLFLAVLPEHQRKGIGTELVKRCFRACEESEWLVQNDCAKGFL